MRKANSNKQTEKLRRNEKPFSSREIAAEINLFFQRFLSFSVFFLLSCPPLSEIRELKIQRRDGDENGQKTIGLKRVRFITKIQDQIKNPSNDEILFRFLNFDMVPWNSKDIFRLCPDLPIPKKPGYLEFCEMRVFRPVRLCCQHIFQNNKLIEIKHNHGMQKRNRCKIFNDRNFN